MDYDTYHIHRHINEQIVSLTRPRSNNVNVIVVGVLS